MATDEMCDLRQKLADAEATLATIGGADKATLARKLRRANAATRDAERLRARITDYRQAMENGTQAACAKTYDAMIAALTAPATQPDEGATEAHHARIAHVGAAVAAQCAAKEGT